MTFALLVCLKVSVVALLCAIGLGSTPADVAYLWRRPALLFRSLLAMYVVVPLAALAVVRTVPMPPAVKIAILVLAISAGAPLLPRKLMKVGREGYVFSLVVTSSLLAVVAVPAWLAWLGPLFGRETSVTPAAVGLVIAKTLLAPLLVGMLLRWPLSAVADRVSEWVLGAAGAVLTLSGLGLLALHGSLLIEVGWVPLAALTGMTFITLAIGHVLGGPDPADRTALAVSCASRHVGIAMLAASTVPGPRTIALVLAYVLAAAAVSIPYLKWRTRPGSAKPLRSGSESVA
jgi:BASS family bile acid:Na+ symporter